MTPHTAVLTDGTTRLEYSTKQTAQFIRQVLKVAFSGTKFSVTISIYSMGSSVRISWMDGPTTPEVDRVAERFSSKSFDGMDDSTHYHDQVVDGQRVSYSGYLSTSRKHSEELRALAKRRAALIGEENVHVVLWTMRPNGCRVMMKAGV